MAKKTARKRPGRSTRPNRSAVVAGVKVVIAAGLAVGLVAGVSWLGRRAADDVADHSRYSIPTQDVRFDPPPHTDPKVFLTEVRYLSGLPETVQSVDPALSDRLAAAFRLHPWVATVTGTTVSPDGQIHVALKYRVPVLAVRWRNGTDREVLAVDSSGVLLPADAPTASLPVLTNERVVPKPDAGKTWPEPDVRRAAELAQRNVLKTIERTKTGWTITEPDGKVYSILAP